MTTTNRWKQLVEVDGRWTVVTIDSHANQVTVPDYDGGRFFVNGTGEESIARAARYTIAHRPGSAFRSQAAAEAALKSRGSRVWRDNDGDLRVETEEWPEHNPADDEDPGVEGRVL